MTRVPAACWSSGSQNRAQGRSKPAHRCSRDALEMCAILLDPAPHTWLPATKVLKALGHDQKILDAVTKIVITPVEYPDAFAAFARARLAGHLEIVAERRDAELLSKAIQVAPSPPASRISLSPTMRGEDENPYVGRFAL